VHVSTVHGSPSSQPLDVPSTHAGSPGSVVVVVDGGTLIVVVDDVVVEEEDVSAVVLVVVATPTIVDVVVVERVLVVLVVTVVEEDVDELVVVLEQAGTGVWRQPLAGSQVSVVQPFPSSQLTGVPPHCPEAQTSAPVQALPSSHAVPSATGVCAQPLAGLQVSVVQAFPSSQLTALPRH